MASGRNPMRWDCNKGGPGANCFNRLKRPKIEEFADCFSRGSAFGDVDGVVDNGGRAFLFLEWKNTDKECLDAGQRRLFVGLTSTDPRFTVVVVCGNAETMEVRAIRVIHGGKIGSLELTDLAGLKRRLCRWWRRGLPASEIPSYDRDHPGAAP